MWAHLSALAGDGCSVFAVVALAVAGTLTVYVLAFGWAQEAALRKKNPPAPPTSPSNMFYNAFVSRMTRLEHFHRMTEWGLRHSDQDAASGVVVRVPMPRAAPHFVIGDYKLARLVLSGSADGSMPECEKTDLIQRLNMRSDVCNLLTCKTANPQRAQVRRALSPAFSFSNLQRCVAAKLDALMLQTARAYDRKAQAGTIFSIKEDNMHITFEILVQSLFSSTLEDIGFSADDFIYAQETYMLETVRGIFNPLRKYMFWDAGVRAGERSRQRLLDFAAKAVESYLEQQRRVAESGQSAAESDDNSFSIMNAIVNHDYPSNDHRLSDIIVFMIAGNDTTAHTLSFFIYNMVRHPEALSKLRAELDAIDPSGARLSDEEEGGEESEQRGGGGRRLMTYTDLANAEYFFHCIKETQRLHPAAPVVTRRSGAEFVYNGMTFPEGSIMDVIFWSINRQSWIDRPDVFDPDRWADTAPQAAKLREMLMPFSVGKRNCIGQTLAMMELRVLAGNLLRYYDFELVGPEPEVDFFVTSKLDHLDGRVKIRR